MASRRRRFLLTAVVLSVAFHVAVALLVMFLPRVVPEDARPQEEGTVELLMVEQKGAQPSRARAPQDSQPTPLQPEKKAAVPKQEMQEPDTQATVPQPIPAPVSERADEPTPPPTEETAEKAAKADDKRDTPLPAAQPLPPKSQEAPVFDLAGTESESNAEVWGGRVVPASPDNRFRNRPPIYPQEAAMLGEHGAVVVVIHVSEAGVATGVDVVQSSG